MKKLLILSLSIAFNVSLFALKPLMDFSNPWKLVKEIEADFTKTEFKERVFDITNYGAREGVENYKTNAINSAINSAASKGGGLIRIPRGVWYTGPITLRTKVHLFLEEGAIVKFSTNPEDYSELAQTRFEGMDCMNYRALIYAYGEGKMAITGKGVFDAQANDSNWIAWAKGKEELGRKRLAKMEADNVPLEERKMTEKDGLRPSFIGLVNCSEVLIEDITILNAPLKSIDPLLSRNVLIKGVTVKTQSPNANGCDLESCDVVMLEKCSFDTKASCISIQAGENNDGRKAGKNAKNIVISNCTMKNGNTGMEIGKAIAGGVKNIWLEKLDILSPDLKELISIKSSPIQGERIDNIFVRNIKVNECKNAVLNIDMQANGITEGPLNPQLNNLIMEDVSCGKSEYGVLINAKSGAEISQVKDVALIGCSFKETAIAHQVVGAKDVVINNESIPYK